MGLLTRFWSRDRFARSAAKEIAGAQWLVPDNTLEPIAGRILSEAEHVGKGEIRDFYEDFAAERKAFAADPDRRRRMAEERLVVKDGVAVIGISGLMMKEVPSAFAMFGGAVSTTFVRLQLQAAEDRRDVRSTLLLLDSPGGSVDGTEALGRDVAAAAKPVHAFAADLACSACLWVGAQADRFTAGKTASIGSIGVYRVIDDTSKMFEEAGIRTILVSSGGVKGALEDGVKVSAEAIAEQKRRITELRDLFVDAVAEGRGMSREAVMKLATGQVWIGEQALELGLIDAVETDDEAFEAARRAAETTETTIVVTAPEGANQEESTRMNLAEIYTKLAKGEQLSAEEQRFLREKAGDPEETPIEARADIPEDVRAKMREAEERERKLAARLDELEKREKRAGYLAEADNFKFVPALSRDQIADELAAADARGEEAGKLIRQHLSATHAALEQSKAFDHFGSTLTIGSTDSPLAQLQAVANEMRAKNPELTPEQALSEAAIQRPELAEAASSDVQV